MVANGPFEKNFRWPYLSNASSDLLLFDSRLGFLARIALFNVTVHKLHELYYDRPTS